MNTYSNDPQFALTNPEATSIVMGAVSVTFDDSTVGYVSRAFTIPAPTEPIWYYVTVASATSKATCQTSDDLVGEQGNIYIGAIKALPSGGSTNVLAGGWPAPQTWIVEG
jgi:hypothetical protein